MLFRCIPVESMNLSGMYDACEGILLTSAIKQQCCVECFHFSLGENTEIVNQSHKVGACPPPRVKHFYRESLFLLIAFAGSYSSTLFGTIIVPVHLQPVGQNVVITTISSGRMSSQHILREDELEDYSWFSPLPWCLSPRSGPKSWYPPQYPQGG